MHDIPVRTVVSEKEEGWVEGAGGGNGEIFFILPSGGERSSDRYNMEA